MTMPMRRMVSRSGRLGFVGVPNKADADSKLYAGSKAIIMANSQATLDALTARMQNANLEWSDGRIDGVAAWTDDYANVLAAIWRHLTN